MKQTCSRLAMGATGGLPLASSTPLGAQMGAKNGEWRTYGGDLGNTHYSPLNQINAANFNKLEIAWRFKTDNLGPRPEYNYESTPLMVNGTVYTTAGSRRAVVAMADGRRGAMLRAYDKSTGKDAGAVYMPAPQTGTPITYVLNGRQYIVVAVGGTDHPAEMLAFRVPNN